MKISEKLLQIIEELKDTSLTPGRLTEIHQILSAEYGWISSQLYEIEPQMYQAIISLRESEGCKSDAQAERLFYATGEGQDLIGYKRSLKAIEKLLSSIRLRVSVMSEESRNQF